MMEVFYIKVMLLAGVLCTRTVQSQTMVKPLCSQQVSTEDAECDTYDLDAFTPSTWTGNFTCSDDSTEIHFVLNITHSSTIDLQGNVYIHREKIHMSGAFAHYFNMLTLQSDVIIKKKVANRYFTNVELNGRVLSSVFIRGFIVFGNDSGTESCPMELRRQETTAWCNGHGFCRRYGKKKEEYVCCCNQEYTGQLCEVEKVTTASITTTSTSVPCHPVNNCTSHYYCGSHGQTVCRLGWTGVHCDTLIVDSPADCDIFDQDEFIPSEWAGNYTCDDDRKLVNFSLNITQSSSTLNTAGHILIGNTSIAVAGSFDSFFKTFTLQGQDFVAGEIFKRNWTFVELNGILRTSLYITGKVNFPRRAGTYSCDAELRRKAVYIDWCSEHGSCYRFGPKKDQISCCCETGFSGDICEVSTLSSTGSTTTSTVPTIEATSRIVTDAIVEMTTTLSTVDTETTIGKASTVVRETTVSQKLMTTVKGLMLEDFIHPGCTSNGWNITVDITKLRQLYPMVTTSHIYFGDNSCHGQVFGKTLTFQQGFRDCLTSERVSGETLMYKNELFYAIYDPINPFIIRQHKWTFTVECDVNRNEATSSHIHHDVDSHHAAVAGHYDIKMTFFKEPNFIDQMAGNPINANIGDDIYIKVFTSAADWTVKMRLHTCYTKPTDGAGDDMTYFIIKNGCEVDSNTHIISQSTHETRFVFQDFEYSTNKEGLNIYCNATFCETKDYSPGCAQSCVSQGTQALVGK